MRRERRSQIEREFEESFSVSVDVMRYNRFRIIFDDGTSRVAEGIDAARKVAGFDTAADVDRARRMSR